MSRIWHEELGDEGVRILSLDPGDMDTPLHAIAVPDADPSSLKQPTVAARELADAIAGALSEKTPALHCDDTGSHAHSRRGAS